MSDMKVICISGRAQHGKDTAAQMMQKYLWGYGKRVLIIHNADLLKYMCKSFFGWNGEKDENGRTLLQYVGTDIVRVKKPDFWIGFIADVLEMFETEWDYVLIPDCRFPNEITVLKDRGFDVIHVSIVRSNFDNALTQQQLAHPSETAMDGFAANAVIQNDGGLTDLLAAVIRFIRPIYESEEERIYGEYEYSIA